MKLILTRKSSNPTCTLGELVSEDGLLRLVTKEGKIPRDKMGYIMWCLPPGTYDMEIEYCAIAYKNKPIRAYWPVLKKIGWFPHAGFYTGTMVTARKGRILLGTDRLDDYQITGEDDACQQLVRWSKALYDSNHSSFGPCPVSSPVACPVSCDASQDLPHLTLTIIQDDATIEFSSLSEHDYRLADERTKEQQEQEQLKNDLYGNLMKD